MQSRSFSVTWLPILGTWAFLIAVAIDRLYQHTSDHPWPLVVLLYFAVSAALAQRLMSLISDPHLDPALTAASVRSTVICLGLSFLAAFIAILAREPTHPWGLLIVALPLVIDRTLAGLTQYSEEQVTLKSDVRLLEQQAAQSSITDWRQQLSLLGSMANERPELRAEIARIESILPYSSFFRSPASRTALQQLKAATDPSHRLAILKSVK